MSGKFELLRSVLRLRKTFRYFRDVATLTGSEVCDPARNDDETYAQWRRLLGDIRDCLSAMVALTPGDKPALKTLIRISDESETERIFDPPDRIRVTFH